MMSIKTINNLYIENIGYSANAVNLFQLTEGCYTCSVYEDEVWQTYIQYSAFTFLLTNNVSSTFTSFAGSISIS
jgi:hypothetical protein